MVYYFKATGVSGEVDPPVTIFMGKHKEESMSRDLKVCYDYDPGNSQVDLTPYY